MAVPIAWQLIIIKRQNIKKAVINLPLFYFISVILTKEESHSVIIKLH